ncbi:hypothetical protein [Neobacillus sp. PS3-40]|uniref:hypothetical protein n=1 Tax=Neobacillus sp. PS3-40 TaxID=3070679 RepID=UPI0027E00D4D|nr:hypothetical protein [Neobacillus sp. PS3-40]WML46158.1 hypothetical protein RCG20_09815 [Neobacillus sp. PS3-40]
MFFDETPTFIYIKETEENLLTIDYDYNVASIRAYLKEFHISSTQYIEEQPSNLFEIVDDISFSIGSKVIMYVDSFTNKEVSLEISKLLKAQNSEIELIWLVESEVFIPLEGKDFIDVIMNSSNLSELVQLLDPDVERDLEKEFHPLIYKNHLIPVTKINNVGLHVKKDRFFEEEIQFIKENESKVVRPVPLYIDGEDIEYVIDLFLSFNLSIPLKPYVKVNETKQQSFVNLKKLNIQEIILEISKETEPAKLVAIVSEVSVPTIITIYAERDTDVSILIAQTLHLLEIGKGIIDVRFKSDEQIHLSAETMELISRLRGYLPQIAQKNALKNGVIAYYTGIYPKTVLDNYVKHVEISETLSSEDYAQVNGIMSLNSAFIHRTAEFSTKNAAKYVLVNGTLQMTNSSYEDTKNRVNDSGNSLSHFHQIDGNHLQLDHFLIEDFPIAPYKEAVEKFTSLLTLESQDDLDTYLSEVIHFISTGTYRHAYQLDSKITNICRWSGIQACNVSHLPRLVVNGNRSLSPCLGCNKAIGALGDELYELRTKVKVITEEQQLLRGCNSCEVRDSCSKCSFLPDYMNEKQYCSIRKNQPGLEYYSSTTQLLKVLIDYTTYFRGVEIEDIRVSNPYVTHLFRLTTAGESLVNKGVFLFHLKEQSILVDSSKLKLTKLNPVMTYVLESLYKGYSKTTVIEEMIKDFQITMEHAVDYYHKSYELFANAGLIQKKEVFV